VRGLDDRSSTLHTGRRVDRPPGGAPCAGQSHELLRTLALALTEDEPTIKPYDEAKWAELHDSRTAPVEVSLQLLESLHDRWVNLMGAMSGKDFERKLRHPENGLLDLNTVLAGYAWHCRHHEAHITGLRQRMGWV
jgi:hypothetical protein